MAETRRDAAAALKSHTELIRRACEAWGSGDISIYREMYAPDVTAHAGELAPEIAGDVHGPEPIIRVFESLMASFDRSELIPGEFTERGDTVVVPIVMRARPHGTTETIEWKTWVFYRFRGGLIAQQGWYAERADAFRAAGLDA